MKLTLIFLLLVGSALAARRRPNEPAPTDQTPENTSKRALKEGNAGVEKRAPVLPTALPVTPGIEYAATKGPFQQKIEDEYADDVPENLRPAVAKISDLLAGQGPAFPAAIHNHLYAPVSAYHNRLANPQTFEVSAPVPSQLAYSEHKISYQPQFRQNVHQFQQILPPEQVIYSHPPQHGRQIYQQQLQQPRFTYNHVPPVQTPHFNQPIIYTNTQIRSPPQVQTNFIQQDPQVLSVPQNSNQVYKNTRNYFPQEQGIVVPQGVGVPSVEIVQSLEPAITYAKQEVRPQTTQKEPLTVTVTPVKAPEKQIVNQHPNQFSQPQGAVSYASFSVGPPAQGNFVPQATQHGLSVQQPSAPTLYNPAINFQPLQVGIISPQNFQQPQYRFQAIPPKEEQQFIQNIEPQPIRSLPQSPRLSYFRPGLSLYRNFYTPDSLQTQSLVLQNPAVPAQSLSPVALPPVQFFGKFAHSIFGAHYQQQQQPERQLIQQQPLEQQQQLVQQQQPQQSQQQPNPQLLQQPQQYQQQQQAYQQQQQLQQ